MHHGAFGVALGFAMYATTSIDYFKSLIFFHPGDLKSVSSLILLRENEKNSCMAIIFAYIAEQLPIKTEEEFGDFGTKRSGATPFALSSVTNQTELL